MLSISDLSYYIGDRALYDGVSLHIRPKDKIGLIGANGTGKSTLLKLIVGEYKPNEGSISKSKECTIGFLNQDLLSFMSEDSILNVAMQAFELQNKLQHEINQLLIRLETEYENEKLLEKLSSLQDEFATADGYSIQAKAEEILEGLGFATKDLSKPLKQFSGGWRMRVMLAKILLARPALLLLDEPTNHLDLPSIEWLEQYVRSYEGAVIIVSHDRTFLDNCVTSIAEVFNQRINMFTGNYSNYLEEKELRDEIQHNSYINQQKKIKDTEAFISRFRAKASKARQVQSRIKGLDRLETIEDIAEENSTISIRFKPATTSGKVVVELKNVSKSYDPLVILKDSNATIMRGDKIALIGANGKGKSTLLRILTNTEPIDGECLIGHNVIPAFFAQHQLESLKADNSILDEMKSAGSNRGEQELRSTLGAFLFTDDDVFKKIRVLSGGERSRVALAKTLIADANFLLLDEPTNHLDMVSVNRLISAVSNFEGTFVVVSHDRHFVANVANKIWYIENHQIKEYPGTYDEYQYWLKTREVAPTPTKVPPTTKPVETKVTKPVQSNPDVKKWKKELEWIEKDIESIEQDIQSKESVLADPNTYNDNALWQSTSTQLNELKIRLQEKTAQWESLITKIDEAN